MMCSMSDAFALQDIPSSSRSREAITRVRPRIAKELADQNLELGHSIFIRIFKEDMALEIWMKHETGFRLFRTYSICNYGSGGLGPKTRQGDGMAPEGFYFVTPSQLNPASDFHLAFNLGYPNRYDTYHGRTGSALMVHGECVSIGCYAMTNSGIEEIYTIADAAFRNGQPFFRVHIFPFKMTGENMTKHKDSEWHEFWLNLKEGYDWFEDNNRIPPDVIVGDGRYVFKNQ
jgi:murein L,D-transpeptidase YafK